MIPCGNNKEFQRSWEPFQSSHNVLTPKRVRDSRRTSWPDVFHVSGSRAHVWEHETWILDTVRLKFRLNFKCVQSTVRTSKCQKVTLKCPNTNLGFTSTFAWGVQSLHGHNTHFAWNVHFRSYVRAHGKSEEAWGCSSISNGTCRRYKWILRFVRAYVLWDSHVRGWPPRKLRYKEEHFGTNQVWEFFITRENWDCFLKETFGKRWLWDYKKKRNCFFTHKSETFIIFSNTINSSRVNARIFR